MRVLVNVLLTSLLAISWGNVFGAQLLSASEQQQNEQQNASQDQQTPPSQTQSSKTAAVKSVTGCVVKSENGYLLKTASDTYPIETDKDLSQYVNKQVEVTGVLEHQHTPTQTESGNAQTVTDIRLRMIVTVVGDCKNPSK
jgi:hypothetical protein